MPCNCKQPAASTKNRIKILSQKCSLPWVAESCLPVLFYTCPFYLSGNLVLSAVSGAIHLGSVELRIILLPRMSEICRTRASNEVRPCFTLHFLAAASLFSWGCCYSFKNKHPRNFLLKQASPLQIQLYSFSWVILSPCCIFLFLQNLLKNTTLPRGKQGEFSPCWLPALLQSPSWLRWVLFPFGNHSWAEADRERGAHPRQDRTELGPPRDGRWGNGNRKKEKDSGCGSGKPNLSFMLAEITGCILF